MPWTKRSLLLAAVGVAVLGAGGPAFAACVELRTAADLNKIRQNLFGDYCVAADIDLSGVANFTPIGVGVSLNPFIGTLDGRGHAIRNLKVRSNWVAGLFGAIGGLGGTKLHVKNLRLINVRVTSASGYEAGGLGGIFYDGTVADTSVTGSVVGEVGGALGGLFGEQHGGTILRSHSSAAVTGLGEGPTLGGLVGVQQGGEAAIVQSYATGPVAGSGFAKAGGLAGDVQGTIRQSFATGPVTLTNTRLANLGGIVGNFNPVFQHGTPTRVLSQSFATGAVTNLVGGDSLYNKMGGLAARAEGALGAVTETYAVGRIRVNRPALVDVGGLLSDHNPPYVDVLKSYWNTETTGVATSNAGLPRTTVQLQSALPSGFNATAWAITPGVSFPYLKLPGLSFWAPLAITTLNGQLFTFLPISQREQHEYSRSVTYANRAGLAAVYTMVARAIGITKNIAAIKAAPIDAFWDEAAGSAQFIGPVTDHASLGPWRPLSATAIIGETNLIGPIRSRRLAAIRGLVSGGAYWMLATSFIVDGTGKVTRLVANDPWTGRQVQIDAVTRRVVSPSSFPFPNFKVDGYRIVTLQ